jgi:hypothetical protein
MSAVRRGAFDRPSDRAPVDMPRERVRGAARSGRSTPRRECAHRLHAVPHSVRRALASSGAKEEDMGT